MTVNLEELPEMLTRITATEAVGTQRDVACIKIFGNQLGPGAYMIGRGNDGRGSRQQTLKGAL